MIAHLVNALVDQVKAVALLPGEGVRLVEIDGQVALEGRAGVPDVQHHGLGEEEQHALDAFGLVVVGVLHDVGQDFGNGQFPAEEEGIGQVQVVAAGPQAHLAQHPLRGRAHVQVPGLNHEGEAPLPPQLQAVLRPLRSHRGGHPFPDDLTLPLPRRRPPQPPTPTLTPTPVPRTVRAENLPDYTKAIPHLWFTRPFTDEFATWGSWYYPYGTNNNGQYLWHRGIDIQNPEGTPIVAVGDGLVVFAERDDTRAVGPNTDFYGQAVVIQHSRGITTTAEPDKTLPVFTLYGHVSKMLVKAGDTVSAGQPIALVGQEGIALGPHLHLEVRLGENSYLATQNPDLWVRPDPGYGIIAGRVIDADGFYVPQQLMVLSRAATPDKFWRQTWTYPDHRYTPDPGLGETFTFADVKAGEYIVKTSFDGHNFSVPVTVKDGEISFVEIRD